MATYGSTTANVAATTNTNETTRAPRTDYTNLIHNGRKFNSLDEMVDLIARERSHVAFKSTRMIFEKLGQNIDDRQLANAMIEANKQMIFDYIRNKDDSRALFGLS